VVGTVFSVLTELGLSLTEIMKPYTTASFAVTAGDVTLTLSVSESITVDVLLGITAANG